MQAIDPAIGLANRVLEREDWARERLSAHAGRTVRMVCGPMASTLAIAPSGMLSPAQSAADLTLSISPLRLPTLLAHPERWMELVAVEGDAALAATLADLARTLPWFVEQAFASALGPLIGTRVADAGRELLSLPDRIRGYGPVKQKSVQDARARYTQLAKDLANPPPAPRQIWPRSSHGAAAISKRALPTIGRRRRPTSRRSGI